MQTDKVGTLKPDNYQVIFQPVVGYTKVNYTDYAEGVGTLKANGGDLGGGQRNSNCRENLKILHYQTTIGAIAARDYKGVGNEYVCEDKCIVYCVCG